MIPVQSESTIESGDTRVSVQVFISKGRRTNTKWRPSVFSLICFSDSSCGPETTRGHFLFSFQPSLTDQEAVVTAAHFWFYAGEGANSSSPLFILTSGPQLLQAAEAPSQRSPDGWTTYDLEGPALAPVAQGPFVLQVRCPACECHADQPDKTPFLDLHAQPRARVRPRRHAPLNVPWSPSAIDLLQRPSQERPEHSDCRRAHVEISFQELGWDNWIVHPTALTFYYCHGNCSAGDRTSRRAGHRSVLRPGAGEHEVPEDHHHVRRRILLQVRDPAQHYT